MISVDIFYLIDPNNYINGQFMNHFFIFRFRSLNYDQCSSRLELKSDFKLFVNMSFLRTLKNKLISIPLRSDFFHKHPTTGSLTILSRYVLSKLIRLGALDDIWYRRNVHISFNLMFIYQ